MALVGVALGVALALASPQGLESLLFVVDAIDPPTLVASILLVGGVAFVAAYVPARLQVEPDEGTALRVSLRRRGDPNSAVSTARDRLWDSC
jgi:hypothetical protein